ADDQAPRVATPSGRPVYVVADVDEDRIDADLELASQLLGDAREALARRDYRSVHTAVDELIAEYGLPSDLRAALAHGVLAANVQALKVIRERVLGHPDHHDRLRLEAGTGLHLRIGRELHHRCPS